MSQLLIELRNLFQTFHFVAETCYTVLSLTLVSFQFLYDIDCYHMLVNKSLRFVILMTDTWRVKRCIIIIIIIIKDYLKDFIQNVKRTV